MAIKLVRRFLLPVVAACSFLHLGASAFAQGDFQVSADGTRVVFTAFEYPGPHELYAVKTTGGPVVKLNGPFFIRGNVLDFRISPDSRRVVYLADQNFPNRFELFSVSIDGGVPVKVTGPFINTGDVLYYDGVRGGAYQINPDGTLVVYIADQLVNERFELFVAPILGGTSVRLNGALAPSCNVQDFQISPDRKRVVFRAQHLDPHRSEVFSASLEGPPRPVKLSSNHINGGFRLGPDGREVLYVPYDLDPLDEVETNELHIVPADGSGPPIVLASGEERFTNATIVPEASRVVFVEFSFATDTLEIFSVPSDAGSPPSQISSSLNVPGAIYVPIDGGRYQISPDGQRIVYPAFDGVHRLFSAPVDGSELPVELNGPLVPGGSVQRSGLGALGPSFRILPDGSRVLYLADQDTLGVVELYSAPMSGASEPLRLVPGVAVDAFLLAPGDQVVFRGEEKGLFSIPLDGSQSPLELTSDAARLSTIGALGHVVYLADGLFSVPIDGSRPPTPLFPGTPRAPDSKRSTR